MVLTIIESLIAEILIGSFFFFMDGVVKSARNDSLREKITRDKDQLQITITETIIPTIQELKITDEKDTIENFLKSQDVIDIVKSVLSRKIHRSEDSLLSVREKFNTLYSRYTNDNESQDVPDKLWKALLDGCETFLKASLEDEELKYLGSLITIQHEEIINAVNEIPKKTAIELTAYLDRDLLEQKQLENENIFEGLKIYFNIKLEILNNINWPYQIDEKTFINIIDIAKGKLLEISRDDHDDLPQKDNPSLECDCLTYIEQMIFDGPTICVGYYGMGKSTISKMFFKEKANKIDIFPIFLNLSHVKLENYCNEGLEQKIIEEVRITLPLEKQKLIGAKSDKITELITSKKILLIIDGIDESLCDKNTIIEFIKTLSNKNSLCFLTCRLEFTPFFNAINSLQTNNLNLYNKINGMRLMDWKEPQWKEYAKGLLEKNPEKEESINIFIKNVIDEKYKHLPARPLFFKMLSDLIIYNQTKYQISLNLEKNLSEIYFKFICWKILDDLNRKRTSIDCDYEVFEKEAFVLLKDLSLIQYNKNFDDETLGVTLEIIKDICIKRDFNVIFHDQIIKILLYSSLFSIIKRKSNMSEFIFSHKSFMEYLVAYNIAEGLLTKNGVNEKPMCNEHWALFQTKEVSDHLMEEIERIQITYKLSLEERNNMLLSAFQSALNEVQNLYEHDERIEEILYYIGKFEILKQSDDKSRQLIDDLKELVENRKKCPEKYFRTVSITLSRVVDRKYCENYVLELLDDLKNDGNRFKLNKEIQLRYYGEVNLRRSLKKDIDKYISNNSPSCIISLKILTYFTTILQKQNEIASEQEYLQKINEMARKMGDNNIEKICSEIDNIIK